MKIPIVIDTNVLISGYLWSGKPRQAIKIVVDPPYELLYCRKSLTELLRVLSEKFYLAPSEIIRIVANIKAYRRRCSETAQRRIGLWKSSGGRSIPPAT